MIPGLYCVGSPDRSAPVLVTANYKLTLDSLRRELVGIDAWILVVDTRGINVWCAGGKGTFSAEEISYQVQRARLDRIVDHRKLILPQLGANGVKSSRLKSLCGFRGVFGPVRAADLKRYLETGTADEAMRSVSFNLRERATLIPLELCIVWKPLAIASLLFFLLSGISSSLFSWSTAVSKIPGLFAASLVAVAIGACLVPLLLPWLPSRRFWLKGGLAGLAGGIVFLLTTGFGGNLLEKLGLLSWIVGSSSYLAMNFTGSTTYTSLSGVKKELREGLGVQLGCCGLATICWLTAGILHY